MIILLDADGVLYDFITPALREMFALGGPPIAHDELDRYEIESYLPESHRERWWARVTAPGFCAGLLPYPGAISAVRELRAMGHDVLCVTSPMDCDTWAGERARALRRDFDFPRDHIISTPGKRWVPGHFFADDTPSHCDRWARANPLSTAILIKRPYNNGVHTLGTFVELVRGWS